MLNSMSDYQGSKNICLNLTGNKFILTSEGSVCIKKVKALHEKYISPQVRSPGCGVGADFDPMNFIAFCVLMTL